MKKIFLLLVCLFSIFKSQAQIVSSAISYACTPTPNIYRIQLVLYRDCSGPQLCANCPTSLSPSCTMPINISAADASNTSYGTQSISVVTSVSGFDAMANLCPLEKSICTNCGTRTPGSFTPGIEKYVFESNISLNSIPSNVCNVRISFSTCCKSPGISVLSNPSSQNVYTEAIINRCVSPCNSSPQFQGSLALNFLVNSGKDQIFQHKLIDPDGDSLAFEMVSSMNGINTTSNYNPPYTAKVPFNYLGVPASNLSMPAGIHLNRDFNYIFFRPNGLWQAPIIIETTQWKKNTLNIYEIAGKTRYEEMIYSLPNFGSAQLSLKTFDTLGVQDYSATQLVKSVGLCANQTYCENLQAFSSIANEETVFNVDALNQTKYASNFKVTKLYPSNNKPLKDSIRVCFTMPNDTSADRTYMPYISFVNRACPYNDNHVRIYHFIFSKNGPKITLNKQKLNFNSYKFKFTNTDNNKLIQSASKWEIETDPKSAHYRSYIADSINYHYFGSAGTYLIKLTVSTQCKTITYYDSIIIDPIKITLVQTKNNTCYNKADGSIQIMHINSYGAVKYKLNQGAWNNGENAFFNLAVGDYWVYVKDSTQQMDSAFVSIGQPSKLNIQLSVISTLKCAGDSNAIVQANATGGAKPYYFYIEKTTLIPSEPNRIFSGINQELHRYVVIDSNHCKADTTLQLTAPTPLIANISLRAENCAGRKDGSATVIGSGGIPPYTVTWNTLPSQAGSTAFNLGVGGVQFYLSDQNNCAMAGFANIPLRNILNNPNICLISFDTLSNLPNIYWNTQGADAPLRYQIFKSETPNGNYFSTAFIPFGLATKYTDPSVLNPNQTVYYKIRLQDSCNAYSPLSNYHRPCLLNATAQNNKVQLNWYPYLGVPGLNQRIWRSIDGGAFSLIATLNTTANSFIDSFPSTQNQYRIEWFSDLNCLQNGLSTPIYSNKVSVQVLGIKEHQNTLNSFSIFPNPAKNLVKIQNVSGQTNAIKNIKISNMLGSVVFQKSFDQQIYETEIDINNLAIGTYIISISNEKDQNQQIPLLIQR